MSSSLQLDVKPHAGLEMARTCFDIGDNDEAIALSRVATQELHKPEDLFSAYLLWACAEWRKGLYRQSLQTLEKAAPFFEEVSPRLRGRFHGQRAVIHSKLGSHDDAVLDLENARYWAEQAGDNEELAIIRNNLSKHYAGSGRFAEATEESDGAIRYARAHGSDLLLGEFCDMRAQNLVKEARYAEALKFSTEAIDLLASHPSEIEARQTHGKALIGLGVTYLEQDDPIARCKARREASKLIPTKVSKELMQLALDRADGRVAVAAHHLGMDHAAFLRVANKSSLQRAPARHRGKSLTKKK